MRIDDKRKYCEGLVRISNESFTTDEVLNDLLTLERASKVDWDRYREIKSNYTHNIPEICSDHYTDTVLGIFKKYDKEGIIFNSISKVSYANKLTMKKVGKDMEGSVPPCFDKNLIGEGPLLDDIIDYIYSSDSKFMNRIKNDLNREYRMYIARVFEEPVYPILKNGSSTSIQDGVNVNDIASIMYSPPEWFLDEFNYYINMMGIGPYMKSTDTFMLDFPMNDKSRIGGDVIHIPDKECKTRTIFRMRWYVQMLSKPLHDILDSVARNIPGNYTYDHKGWFKSLNAEGFNQTKHILTTDMTKYSDTLQRSFMIEILRASGWDEELLIQIDKLWSLPVIDSTGKVFEGTLSSYQGQYSNFPMITIANLVIQSFIYHKHNLPIKRLSLAAVGDDTGMVFDDYMPDMLDYVQDAYGSVGVNINRSKTHELVMGEGKANFVKLDLTSKGVVPFINPSPILKGDKDGTITEVYDYIRDTGDKIGGRNMFESLFGPDIADKLMNLSVINGGISDHVITRKDIAIFKVKMSQFTSLKKHAEDDEMRKWIRMVSKRLDDKGVQWIDTPMLGWIVGYEEWYEETGGDPNEYIKMNMINASEIGYDLPAGEYDLSSIVGMRWSELSRLKIDNALPDEIDAIYTIIDQSESVESYRRREKVKKRRSIYEGILNMVNHVAIYDNGESSTVIRELGKEYIRRYDDYEDMRDRRVVRDLERKFDSVFKGNLIYEYYFGNLFAYIHVDGRKYRHYTVSTQSVYSLIPEDVYNRNFDSNYMPYQEYLKSLSHWEMLTRHSR